MEGFDQRYQEHRNGPLSKEVRARLQRFRENGSTLAEIGTELGISGAFVSKLLSPKPANISTVRVPRIIKALEHHEELNGFAPKRKPETEATPSSKPTKLEDAPLEDLIRAISAKGFNVSVTPKGVR